jgi:hypothetical protein
MPAMFDCAKRRMRLTVSGCAKLWTSANDPESRPAKFEGRFACLACPIGAANAGQYISPTAAVVEALRCTCARCLRPSDRIIKARLCISCYNRERELLIGRNAKGRPPRLKLSRLRVVVVEAGVPRTVEQTALSLLEIILATARTATGSISFGRPSVIWERADG